MNETKQLINDVRYALLDSTRLSIEDLQSKIFKQTGNYPDKFQLEAILGILIFDNVIEKNCVGKKTFYSIR